MFYKNFYMFVFITAKSYTKLQGSLKSKLKTENLMALDVVGALRI